MSLAHKILSNTAWQVIGKFTTALLGIVSVKLITNYLSTAEYGEYTAIYDFVAIFAMLADFGLFTIAVREMARDKEDVEKILGNVLSVRTFLGLVSLGVGIGVAFLIPKYQGTHIPFGIPVVALAAILMLMSGTIATILQLHLKMQWFSIAMLAGKIVSVAYIAFTILVLFPRDPSIGFTHLLYGWVFGNILTLLITFLPARKLAKIRFRLDFGYWKEVIVKTLPYGLALLLGTIYFRTGSVLMSFLGMQHEVGLYGVPMKIFEFGDLIPVFFMNSVLPALTQALRENIEGAKRIIQYALEFMALLAFPMFLGGWVLRKPLIAALSNDAFLGTKGALGADFVLPILLFALMLFYFHVAFRFSLIALGLQRNLLIINAVAAVFNIALNLIVIPKWSFVGVGVVAIITECIILIGNFFMLSSRLHFRPRLVFITKTLFASAIMGGIIFFLDPFLRSVFALKSLFLLIPLGALVYLGSLFLLRAFTPEMLSFLRKPKAAVTDPPSSV